MTGIMETRTIVIPKAVVLPARFTRFSQDADGRWFAYVNEPRQSMTLGKWVAQGGDFMEICTGLPNPDWRNTLTKID